MKMKDMREKQYCLSIFEDKFSWLKNERIALFGTGINAKDILKKFPDYNIICLIDDKWSDRYVGGYYVASFEEFLTLGIDKIIIAARTESALAVYDRIGSACLKNNISVYDFYGNDMHALKKNVVSQKIEFTQNRNRDLEACVEKYDVISIDFDNTLMSAKNVEAIDFFRDIEKSLRDSKINVINFVDKIVSSHQQNVWTSLKDVCTEICKSEKVSEKDKNKLLEIVKSTLKESLIVREPIRNILEYALSQQKKVCIIEDMQAYRIPTEWMQEILEYNGIKNIDRVICSSAYSMNKFTGLYRILMEQYAGLKCLHIGDHLESDYLVPQFYGIDTFMICSAFNFNQMFGETPVNREMLDNPNLRKVLDAFLMEAYNNVCFPREYAGLESKALALKLKLKGLIGRMKQGAEPVTYEPVLFDDIVLKENIEEYEKLVFSKCESPMVSIVIPVYNQFGYTYNCLKTILEHSGDVTYEVIVADDCSTDQVKELEKVAEGITVVHNKKNLRFLLNCNNAATFAKGKYILFLNNDTQVQPGWLQPLVETLELDEQAGMVGSKLVYPDGHLQEAGGILWKDGSAWNYGNMKNPDEPEYCYMKEADYISGAAIMIRASLWKKIGGFDETFVPAYYEDTDLAFEVRRNGYKVLLQPASIVVHFEGVSNGTDTSTGLKAYQVANQKKFFEKWRNVLEKDHFPNAQNVYLAKDRGQFKKQILVVDHYVPNYDRDAGGRCTYMYIKMFLKMGFKVTFIGDNFSKPQPYTDELNKLGVEILYGNYYYNNWQSWLQENLHYFDYVYLQRPHISIKYIDLVKKYARGKIFYFAHDLHHIRMYRDYILTGDKKALEESEKWKEIEMKLFSLSDVGHVVGSYEQEVMQKEFPAKPIRNIPLYIYDEMPENVEKDFSKRKDILFVGGFGHTPNVDAVKWFASEVFPKILQKYPDIVWHIVGSKAPEEIVSLASKNIVLEGFVSDEKLAELYQSSRLAVVPLRYGAGVKGKVVEAAYYQIPLVTTSIGGEGLDSSTDAFIMEDSADEMAQLVCDLYSDFSRLKEMSDAGAEFIAKYFTSKVAEEVLLSDMKE